MSYVVEASTSPAFLLHGLAGYEFLPLKDPDFSVHILDVRTGHDTFMISKALTRIYYIIEGEGVFTIDNQNHDVSPGLLVEVPPGVEYSYSGRMKILLVSHPRWFEGNERMTRKNPNVASEFTVERVTRDRLARNLRSFLRRISVVTRFRRAS